MAHPRRYTRPALTILALFLAGAVINVLVAWACARWAGFSPTATATSIDSIPPEADAFINDAEYLASFGFDLKPTPNGMRLFFNPEKSDVGEYTTGLNYFETRSVARTQVTFARWFNSPFTFAREHRRMQFGLPMRSLEFAEQSVWDLRAPGGPHGAWHLPGWRGGWPITDVRQGIGHNGPYRAAHVYPLVPIPLGFATNTAIYALLLFALVITLRSLLSRSRHSSRRRRGLCVKCAYPIGTSPICTECGTPTNAAQTRNAA